MFNSLCTISQQTAGTIHCLKITNIQHFITYKCLIFYLKLATYTLPSISDKSIIKHKSLNMTQN